MARTKQKKMIEIKRFPNSFDKSQEAISKLVKKYFNNNNSISLELGCGEGDYTVQLAKHFPDRNFIGIDIKASRIYTGARRALDAGLANAAFISMRIENLAEVFENEKIEEIFIPFPDPHVRRKSAPRRLVSPEFLKIYKSILSDKGRIHFKTDNDGLFEYAIEAITKAQAGIYKINEDVNPGPELTYAELTSTRYERHYKADGRTIKYVCFGFNDEK